jgi:Na+/phosphate symporter
MAAIGASSTAKRLALAYILFKLIAAVIALILFPVTTTLLVRASGTVDGVTLLAAYHTAYNVVGVPVLLPVIDKFTRLGRSVSDATTPRQSKAGSGIGQSQHGRLRRWRRTGSKDFWLD